MKVSGLNPTTLTFSRNHRSESYPFAITRYRNRKVGPILSGVLVILAALVLFAVSQIHLR